MSLTTMEDLPKAATAMPTITIYGPVICPNCQKATNLLDRHGIPYTKIDLEPGDKNHCYVKDELGYETAPVITVAFDDRTVHWGGHRLDMLMALKRLCAQVITAQPSIDTRGAHA